MGHKHHMRPVSYNDDGSVDYKCDQCDREFTQRQFISPRRLFKNRGNESVDHDAAFGSGIPGADLEMGIKPEDKLPDEFQEWFDSRKE